MKATEFTHDRRHLRANRFASEIMHLLQDYLPQGRDIQRRIYDLLWEAGRDGNLQVISVPPELDELTKLELERRMLETHPVWIAAAKDFPLAAVHKSDCAVNNGPALPPGPCDCGADQR